MSGTGAQVLGGLKAAKDIVAQKATGMKLNHQLSGLKHAIGKAAHDHGIDCGECSRKAAAVLADVQKANQRIGQASAAMKQSAGVKEKTVAAKDFTTAKAAQKTAEMRMNTAYDALGDYILANGITVSGMENEIATAQSVQQKVQATNQQIGQLGSGLMKNKIGLAAVAAVALVVVLIGWSAVGRMFGEKKESWQLGRNECTSIATKCVALADTYPDEAVRLLNDKIRITEDRQMILDIVAKMPQADQDKFAKVWKLWQAREEAAQEKGERGWAEAANDPEFNRIAEERRQQSQQTRPSRSEGRSVQGDVRADLEAYQRRIQQLTPGPNATAAERQEAVRKQMELSQKAIQRGNQDPVFRENFQRQADQFQQMINHAKQEYRDEQGK